MKLKLLILAVAAASALFVSPFISPAHAEKTISCAPGQYDMLDWMTLDSDLRGFKFLTGSNPMYTAILNGKFSWTKGPNGYPWDIDLYDGSYIYQWITEYAWNNPWSFKKFTYNTNMPLAPRCAWAGFPGSTIQVSNTWYDTYTNCTLSARQSLGHAVNQVWGPYYISFGGSLPSNLPTLVVSYRYNCDSNHNNCGDKEEYYLTQRYGNVQWIHYALIGGKYQQQQKAVFNWFQTGWAAPNFPCF